MANSRKTNSKPATVTQFPTPDGSVAVEDPPETIPETPFDGEAPQTTAPPPAPKPEPKKLELTFFQKVAAIPAADWGHRVYLYLYVIEPVCNLRQSGGKAYLMRYEEPITSEHPIMLEHGSGKYRFILAKNKFVTPSPDGNKSGGEIGMLDFEIFNPQYPPKIPREAWANDSKNRRWETLLPKPVPPAPASAATGLSDFVEVMRATSEMRKEVRDEVQAATPTAPAAPATPAAPAPVDPFDTAKKIMEMRSNDPMITLLLSRMDAQDKAMEAARLREFELQKELRQQTQTVQQAAAPKGVVEQLKELAELKTLAGTVFGIATDAAAPLRPGKFGWLDFGKEVIPEIMNSRILNALADRITAGAPQLNPANGNGQHSEPRTMDTMTFVQAVITPALVQHFEREQDGGDFAAWVFDGHPDKLAELQGFGEQRIFTLYKNHAPRGDWATLISRGEPAFAKFVHEFCIWKPEPDEDDKPAVSPMATGSTVIDLDVDDREEKGA